MTPAQAAPPVLVRPRRPPLWLWLGLVAVGAGVLLGLTLEQPLVAVAVPLVAAGAWALLQAPLKVSAYGLLFSVLLLEGLSGPLIYGWEPPLMPLARLLMTNLNSLTGVGFLRAPLVDVLTVALVIAAVVKRKDATFGSRTPSVRPLHVALLVSALTVVGLDVLGTVRGGDFNESLWQLRQSLLFPLRALLLLRAVDGTESDLKTLAKLLIAAGTLKALIGIAYVQTFVLPSGREIESTTSHFDTLLFVPLLALYFNLLLEKFELRLLLDGAVWVPVVTLGMVYNDRRLAYVSLAIAVVISLVMSPATRLKRLILRATLLLAPLIPPYVLLGWTSTGGAVFWAARLVKSVIVGDPNQGTHPDYRDLENVNVLFTWSNNPLIPQGWGHRMQLLFPLPDISPAMPTWQFHPHNQYLWFMAIGGPIGFTLMLAPQIITVYLCARTYRVTNELWVRVWCLTGIAIVAAYFSQMYGDMGTLAWAPSWMAALAAAVAAKVAVRSGAWPVSNLPTPPKRH